MKKIKRYLIALLVCIMAFSMSVFAEEESTEKTISDLEFIQYAENNILSTFKNSDVEFLKYQKKAESSELLQDAIDSYISIVDGNETGKFLKFSDETVTREDNNVVISVVMKFEKMDIDAKCVLTNFNGTYYPNEITFAKSAGVEKSFGDKMKDAALNTVMGIFTVVVVLLLISMIISLFKYIPKIQKKFENKGKTSETDKAVDTAIAQIEEKEELADDFELVAVISAAIAATTGTSSDGFVVRSIKKAKRSR